MLALLFLLPFAFALPLQYELYEGHKVVRVVPSTDAHVKALRDAAQTGALSFWTEPKRLGHFVDVQVPPQHATTIVSLLQQHNMVHNTIIDDLRPYVLRYDKDEAFRMIEKELQARDQRVIFKAGDHPSFITTDQYHNYDEIMAYLDSVVTTYPTIATMVNIGRSLQNRSLRAVKEWISQATIIYIINELTANSQQYRDLLDKIDLYLMPILNPDGYSYTWTNNRLWRKTRSGPYGNNCFGVDPNRNWNFHWGTAGTTNNPCDDTYDGPSPFSEVETRTMASWLAANNNTIKSYFDLHSYSEEFMYPYGYADVVPDDVAKIRALAGRATAAINAVNGQRFVYGSIYETIYPASGTSIDYTKGVLNIDYSANGFLLPESQIIAGASEAWAGLQVVFQAVADGQ